MSLHNRYKEPTTFMEKISGKDGKCRRCNEIAKTAKQWEKENSTTGMKPSDSDASWLLSATRPWGPQMKFTPSCFMMFTPHTGTLPGDHVP